MLFNLPISTQLRDKIKEIEFENDDFKGKRSNFEKENQALKAIFVGYSNLKDKELNLVTL